MEDEAEAGGMMAWIRRGRSQSLPGEEAGTAQQEERDGDGGGSRGERERYSLFGRARLNQHPVCADAGLPRIPEGRGQDACGSSVQVGILEDNQGSIPSELQRHLSRGGCKRYFMVRGKIEGGRASW